MKNDIILHKWINGTITSDELSEFQQRPEFETLIKIYKNTEGIAAPEIDSEKMLAEILGQAKIRKIQPQAKRRTLMPNWAKYAVAASILLLGFWIFFLMSSTVNYQTAFKESQTGTLPDGSTFILNADSKLSFDNENWAENRELELSGEAFFEVKKGEKFTVKTGNGNVQVLGTAFNVRVRKTDMEVKCHSGKVAVISTEGNTLTELTKNQAIRVSAGEISENWEMRDNEKEDLANGIFRFKKVELSVVLAEMERQFDVSFKTDLVDTTEIISTNFSKENLDLALTSALKPLGLDFKFKREGKEIILIK